MKILAESIHPFEATISVVGVVVGGIVFLTLFFHLSAWFSRRSASKQIAFKGILDERTPATVHTLNGNTFENVYLIGFTGEQSPKDVLPYDLRGMVILEHQDGRRTLIQAKSVKMIEIAVRA